MVRWHLQQDGSFGWPNASNVPKKYLRKNLNSQEGETVLHNVNTSQQIPATAMDFDQRPPCCRHTNGGILEHLIPATLLLRTNASVIHVLVGCLQTNIISKRVAYFLDVDGGILYKTDIIFMTRVGGQSYGVQGIMNLTITLTNYDENET